MRKQKRLYILLTIVESEVERVGIFKFLPVHIGDDFIWTSNITQLVKKAQQWLYFQGRLRKSGQSLKILRSFYSCIIENILTQSGKCCGEDPQGTSIISAGHPPPESPQQSLQHHQRLHPSQTQGFHSYAHWHEVQKCEMQDIQSERQLLSLGHHLITTMTL